MNLSVIVPIYNEEKNIQKNIQNFDNFLIRQNFEYEIIAVDDGSKDNTLERLKELKKNMPTLKIITYKKNQGKGYAVKKGMLNSKGNYALFLDADGATAIDHLKNVWPKFNEGCEVVIASRNALDNPGSKIIKKQAIWKQLFGRWGNRLIQLLTKINIYDTQCGFKAFTKNATREIIPKINIKRWMFDVEILIIAKNLNKKIGIIPIKWQGADFSRVGVKGYFISLYEIIKIKFNIIFKKYK